MTLRADNAPRGQNRIPISIFAVVDMKPPKGTPGDETGECFPTLEAANHFLEDLAFVFKSNKRLLAHMKKHYKVVEYTFVREVRDGD